MSSNKKFVQTKKNKQQTHKIHDGVAYPVSKDITGMLEEEERELAVRRKKNMEDEDLGFSKSQEDASKNNDLYSKIKATIDSLILQINKEEDKNNLVMKEISPGEDNFNDIYRSSFIDKSVYMFKLIINIKTFIDLTQKVITPSLFEKIIDEYYDNDKSIKSVNAIIALVIAKTKLSMPIQLYMSSFIIYLLENYKYDIYYLYLDTFNDRRGLKVFIKDNKTKMEKLVTEIKISKKNLLNLCILLDPTYNDERRKLRTFHQYINKAEIQNKLSLIYDKITKKDVLTDSEKNFLNNFNDTESLISYLENKVLAHDFIFTDFNIVKERVIKDLNMSTMKHIKEVSDNTKDNIHKIDDVKKMIEKYSFESIEKKLDDIFSNASKFDFVENNGSETTDIFDDKTLLYPKKIYAISELFDLDIITSKRFFAIPDLISKLNLDSLNVNNLMSLREQLKTHDENKLLNFLSQFENKTYYCQECAYHSHIKYDVDTHIKIVHKKKLEVLFGYSVLYDSKYDGQYTSLYTPFTSLDMEDIFSNNINLEKNGKYQYITFLKGVFMDTKSYFSKMKNYIDGGDILSTFEDKLSHDDEHIRKLFREKYINIKLGNTFYDRIDEKLRFFLDVLIDDENYNMVLDKYAIYKAPEKIATKADIESNITEIYKKIYSLMLSNDLFIKNLEFKNISNLNFLTNIAGKTKKTDIYSDLYNMKQSPYKTIFSHMHAGKQTTIYNIIESTIKTFNSSINYDDVAKYITLVDAAIYNNTFKDNFDFLKNILDNFTTLFINFKTFSQMEQNPSLNNFITQILTKSIIINSKAATNIEIEEIKKENKTVIRSVKFHYNVPAVIIFLNMITDRDYKKEIFRELIGEDFTGEDYMLDDVIYWSRDIYNIIDELETPLFVNMYEYVEVSNDYEIFFNLFEKINKGDLFEIKKHSMVYNVFLRDIQRFLYVKNDMEEYDINYLLFMNYFYIFKNIYSLFIADDEEGVMSRIFTDNIMNFIGYMKIGKKYINAVAFKKAFMKKITDEKKELSDDIKTNEIKSKFLKGQTKKFKDMSLKEKETRRTIMFHFDKDTLLNDFINKDFNRAIVDLTGNIEITKEDIIDKRTLDVIVSSSITRTKEIDNESKEREIMSRIQRLDHETEDISHLML